MSQNATPKPPASPMSRWTGCMRPRCANSSSRKSTRSLGWPLVRAIEERAPDHKAQPPGIGIHAVGREDQVDAHNFALQDGEVDRGALEHPRHARAVEKVG